MHSSLLVTQQLGGGGAMGGGVEHTAIIIMLFKNLFYNGVKHTMQFTPLCTNINEHGFYEPGIPNASCLPIDNKYIEIVTISNLFCKYYTVA